MELLCRYLGLDIIVKKYENLNEFIEELDLNKIDYEIDECTRWCSIYIKSNGYFLQFNYVRNKINELIVQKIFKFEENE